MDDVRINPVSSFQNILRRLNIRQQSVLFSTILNFGPLQFKNEKYFINEVTSSFRILTLSHDLN